MTKYPSIPEVVCQQPRETIINHHKLDDIKNEFPIKTTQETQGLENMQLSDEAGQTSPPKGLQLRNSEFLRTSSEKIKPGTNDYSSSTHTKICPTDILEANKHIMTALIGDKIILLLKGATSHIEELLVSDERIKNCISR